MGGNRYIFSEVFAMKKCLIVVDYQNDFVSGALGFPGAAELEQCIARKIEQYRGDGGEVVFTFDTHGEDYLDTQGISESFEAFAYTKGLRPNPYMLSKSKRLIENWIKAYIVRNIIGEEGFYYILHKEDNTLKRAIKELSK